MHGNDCNDLPLFNGPHIRQIRFERALECLDLRTAVEAAPEEWKAAVEEMAVVLEQAGRPVRAVRGWELLAIFEPVRAAARCGFHGGPLLDTAGELIDLVCEDGLQPVEHWLLNYAWFTRQLRLDDIRDALDAEDMLAVAPFAVPGDARAFAWYLLDAGGQRYVGPSVGVIEARQRLQRISEVAFRRYLARV